MLGNGAYQLLFKPSGIDPIGKMVRVGSDQFQIVGVFAARPSPGNFSLNQDDFVALPHTTFQRVYGVRVVQSFRGRMGTPVMLSAIPREGVSQEAAVAEIERIMRTRHGLRLDEQNDFDIVTQDALMRVWNQISQATFFALVVISSIALMVGGIGVMAIMSISVTERTREIGVRRALGARRREVLFQFLTEAAVLTSVGGLLGILLGSALGNGRALPHRIPRLASALVLRAGHRLLRNCRHRLRHVPRDPRRPPRSDRSAAGTSRSRRFTVHRLPFAVHRPHFCSRALLNSSMSAKEHSAGLQEARGVAKVARDSASYVRKNRDLSEI